MNSLAWIWSVGTPSLRLWRGGGRCEGSGPVPEAGCCGQGRRRDGLLVLGIGNELRSDDAVGVRIVRSLAASEGQGVAGDDEVSWLEGGTRGLTLLEPIERCAALIAVDAAELGARPGTVRVLEGEQFDRFADGGAAAASAHEFGLGALCAAARLRGCWPGRRALVAVQPGSTDWGTALSPALERALPVAARQIRRLIACWGAR